MTTASTPGPSLNPQASNEPSYELGRRESEVIARFPSGKRVPVTRGRARVYPGLRSPAPNTLTFYQTFAPLVTGKHVLDAGSGASQGTRLLCAAVPHVSALDNDARALEFGRSYAPDAEFLQVDLCHGAAVDRADAAFLVDVLGHLARPDAALRGLRACLPVGAQVFVAEPKAYGAQRLLAPVSRAFSAAQLQRLLLRTGFEVEDAGGTESSFVMLLGRRSGDRAIEALVEGFQHTSRSRFSAARGEFLRARQTDQPAVKLEAVLGQAEVALAENDGDGAVRYYFEANELDATDSRALAGLAHVALATGEMDDALRLALDALKRDPIEVAAHVALALAAEQLSHPDAFNAWRIAANLAPDDLEIATGLARVSSAQNNFSFAIQAFERLRGYGTALNVEFHVTLGWLLLAEGRKNDASVEAQYAAAVAPAHDAVAELMRAIEAA